MLNVGVRELGVWYVVPDYFFGDGEDSSRIENFQLLEGSCSAPRCYVAAAPAIKDLDRIDRSAVAESPPSTMKEFGGARVSEGDMLQERSQKRRRGNRDLQDEVQVAAEGERTSVERTRPAGTRPERTGGKGGTR